MFFLVLTPSVRSRHTPPAPRGWDACDAGRRRRARRCNAGRAAAEHFGRREKLLMDFEPGDQSYFGVIDHVIRRRSAARAGRPRRRKGHYCLVFSGCADSS